MGSTFKFHNSTDEHISGWVSAPDARGTNDILWTCLFTVFVCTWTILHLNVPANGESPTTLIMRKARWMTMAIIVPEVVTCTAFVQRVAARNATSPFKGAPDSTLTLSHGFYFNMGGLMLKPLQGNPFPINSTLLKRLITSNIIALPDISFEDIWDRSKVDRFAKICACLQIFWLAIETTGRGAQNLAITPLEIATLGFAVPSLATFLFWFHKPVDIKCPTTIDPGLTVTEMIDRLSLPMETWEETPLDRISRVNAPSFTSELLLKSSYWSNREEYTAPATRIRNDVFGLKYTICDQLAVATSWVGYAGTHFSAWDFSFPTRTEQLLWRASCVIMTATMAIFWLTSNRKVYLLFTVCACGASRKERLRKVAYERQKVSSIQIAAGGIGAFMYLFARVTLLILAFASLRSLPRSAFQTVSWSSLLPHFG